MSTICATKRDLEKIAKKRYVFDERLFNVYIISLIGVICHLKKYKIDAK